MKKSMLFGALAVSLATSSGYGQSVEELIGLTISRPQAPDAPVGTGHATAEESPFYVRLTVSPIIEGAINTNPSDAPGNTSLNDSKVEFDLGIGVGATFGFRIPETYIFIEVATGFQWAGVKNFSGEYDPAGTGNFITLDGDEGNLYQVPIIITPGIELELPGGWPFMEGGAIRFGPTVGVMYHDLAVNNIRGFGTGAGQDLFSFGTQTWVFTYGVMLSVDLFLSHNVAFTMGYQFLGTLGVDYGALNELSGNVPVGNLPDIKTNFTYANIISCGISIYF